jgi:hypothetical protein
VGVATLIPTRDECEGRAGWLNDGELRVIDALTTLSEGWTVYVQPRLGLDMPDFVAVHDEFGVCAIEVKDWAYGKYERDGRTIVFGRDRQRVGTHPRLQAHRYRSAIFEHYFALPDDKGGPVAPSVRALVIVLNHPTKDARELLAYGKLGQVAQVPVGGEEILDSIEQELIGSCPAKPTTASIEKLRHHLDDAVHVARMVGPEKLSAGALNIAKNQNDAKMRRVRGSAGCGKSYGLAARAAALAAQGKSVLVVSFNVTLSHYLRGLVTMHCASYGADPTLVSCTHFHGYCGRLVDDAKAEQLTLTVPNGTPPWNRVIAQAVDASRQGIRRRFDAVLVDEGQDFELDWWKLLRSQVSAEGEMLLVADPTQNIFGLKAWTEEDHMRGAGFSGPWTELGGSYRLPRDMVPILSSFGQEFLSGEVVGPTIPDDGVSTARTVRRWQNVSSGSRLAHTCAEFTHGLITNTPGLRPSDVVLLLESHRQGLDAVRQLKKLGHDVHHIFALDDDEQRRRKKRFWPDGPGIKACTVHSFKGWEARAVVLGIGRQLDSARLAYVAMTRLHADPAGSPSYIAVVNANPVLNEFRETFKNGVALPPPDASNQVA